MFYVALTVDTHLHSATHCEALDNALVAKVQLVFKRRKATGYD